MSLRSRRQHKAWGVSPRGMVAPRSSPRSGRQGVTAARFTGSMALPIWSGVPPSAPPQALFWRPLRGL